MCWLGVYSAPGSAEADGYRFESGISPKQSKPICKASRLRGKEISEK